MGGPEAVGRAVRAGAALATPARLQAGPARLARHQPRPDLDQAPPSPHGPAAYSRDVGSGARPLSLPPRSGKLHSPPGGYFSLPAPLQPGRHQLQLDKPLGGLDRAPADRG